MSEGNYETLTGPLSKTELSHIGGQAQILAALLFHTLAQTLLLW